MKTRMALASASFLLLLAGCRQADAEARRDTLRLRLAQDPATLDPAHAVDAHAVAVVSQIHDGLVRLDPTDLEVKPALARSWELSPDGLTYTFRLRPDARFHDGRGVTAQDVVFSFERVLAPSIRSPRPWVLTPIAGAREFAEGHATSVKGLRAMDDTTLQVTLNRPFAPFLSHLALEAASVVPAGTTDHRHRPIGCGPFKLESWVHGERLTLRRVADGTMPLEGGIQKVQYRIIPSESTALEEYLAGNLDVADEVPVGQRARAAGMEGEYRTWSQPAVAFLGFNHDREPFRGNRALRQAFNHAVDKRFIARVINEGKDAPAAGILPPGVPGHDPDLSGYPFDPERARQLLVQAGYPQGRGLPEIALYFHTSESQRRIMEQVRLDLERIGVRVRLKVLDPAALMQSLDVGEPAFFKMSWLADYPDADALLTPLLHSRSRPQEGNFSRYASPELDALLDRARVEPDHDRRVALYRQAQKLAVEDACWVFLYYHGDEALVKPHVLGLELPVLGDFLAPLERVHLAVASKDVVQ